MSVNVSFQRLFDTVETEQNLAYRVTHFHRPYETKFKDHKIKCLSVEGRPPANEINR